MPQSQSARPAEEQGLRFEALEPRILFSATAVDSLLDQEAVEAPQSEVVLEKSVWQSDEPSAGVDELEAEHTLLANLNHLSADIEARGGTELIFLSAGLYDADYLSDHLSPAFEVYRIDPGSDALAQIAAVVQGRSGIDAIHLIGHGEAGRLFLGDTVLNQDSMAGSHGETLRTIGLSLAEDSDILIYGCDFAAGEEGAAAVAMIAELTGADVAASTDDTGAASLGGDWDLEYQAGAIEASAVALPGFAALLAPPVWSISGSSSVTEGSSASYTLSLTGAVQSGTSVSVDLALADLTTASADHASFVSAVNAAIASRPELSFNGTTLTYSPPLTYSSSLITSGSSYSSISGLSGVNSHNLGDDASTSQTIGFNFDFYGTNYSSLFIGSNGFVTFGAGSSNYTNSSFASGGTIDSRPAIAPLWDDWNPGATSGTEIFSITTGTAGNRQFIVQWSSIVHYGGSQTASFQMVLNESDGSIEFRYLDVTVESGWTRGGSATIGLSDGASRYNQFSFDTASINDNQRIVYSRSVSMSPLTITLGTTNDTTPEASESYQISLSNASNSTLGTSTVTTTIVDNDPAPPVAVTDAFTAAENSGAAVVGNALSNDSDPNGDTLSATVASGAGSNGGLFSIAANGQVTFNPNGQFENLGTGQTRVTSYSYTVNDGNGGSTSGTVNVTVQGSNDAPVASGVVPTQSSNDGQTITPLNLSGYFSDIDTGDTLGFSASGLPAGLSIHPSTGVISGTLTSSASTTPSYSVVVTATDGGGLTASRSFTWNVSNPVPIAGADTFTSTEDAASAVVGNVLSNDSDPDGDSLSVTPRTAVAGSQGGLFWIAANGAVTFSPNGAFENLAAGQTRATSVSYTLVDAQGATATATVTVTVSGENDAPVASGVVPTQSSTDSQTISPLNLSTYFSDIDTGDTINFSATGLPAGLAIHPGTGVISGTLNSSASTTPSYSVVVTATDAGGLTATRSFTWNVSNPAPIAVIDTFTSTENAATAVVGNVLTNDSDPDSDTLSVVPLSAVTGSNGGLFSIASNGAVTFSPNGAFEDLAVGQTRATTVTYTLQDANGATTTATVTVDVSGENDAPITVPASITVNEESLGTSLGISAPTDVDGNTLTITVTSLPSVGTVKLASGTAVTNGMALSLAQLTSLVYDAPSDLASAATTSFSYSVSDGTVATPGTVGITVNPVNDAPVATDDSFVTDENQSVSIDVLLNDADVDNVSITITEVDGQAISDGGASVPVANGTVTLSGGVLVFVPSANYHGPVSFTYTISDGSATATATVNGDVNDVVQSVTLNHVSTAEDGTLTFTATLDRLVAGGFTVDVATVSGSALSGVDFVAMTTTLTFAGTPGETITFTVNPIEDNLIEGDETFTVVLSNVSNAAVIISSVGTGTIIENDARVDSAGPGTGITTDLELVANGSGGFDLVVEDVETDSSFGSAVSSSDSADNLLIYRDGTDYVIRDLNGLWIGSPIVGATRGANNEIRVPVSLVTGNIIVRTGSGDDSVTIRNLGASLSGGLLVDLENGTGRYLDADTLNYDSSTTFGASAQLRADTINALQNSSLTTTGTGTIHFDAGRNILLGERSALSSASGDITLEANLVGGGSGRYQGLVLQSAEIESTSGDVRLEARGGTVLDRNFGVNLTRSVIETGGAIEVIGTGGGVGTAGAQLGVVITTSQLRATGIEDVTLRGVGGNGNQYGAGVTIEKNSVIQAASGDLLIYGTGSTTGSNNFGVSVGGSRLQSSGGDLLIEGTGAGSNSGFGVRMANTTAITTGNGAITLQGRTSGTGKSNVGVQVQGSSSLTSQNGDINLLGTSNANGNGNHGVTVLGKSVVQTTSGSGDIVVNGTGGIGAKGSGVVINAGRLSVATGSLSIEGTGRSASYGRGVEITKATLQSTGGNLSIDGRSMAAGSGQNNTGIFGSGATISATGSGAVALRGTGGAGLSANNGVQLAGTRVEGAAGILVSGSAGNSSKSSSGVALERGTTLAGSGSGAVTVNGTGSSTGAVDGRYHRGVKISASTLSAADGNLAVSGTGGGDGKGSLNHGVELLKSNLSATGNGQVLLSGSGDRGGSGILGSKSSILSSTGAVTVTGTGGIGTKDNRGVSLTRSVLRSTDGGNITAQGTANPATNGTGNVGVFIERGTVGTTGSFAISGTGGGGVGGNHGVFMNKVTNTGAAIAAVGVKTDGSSKSKNRAGDYFS